VKQAIVILSSFCEHQEVITCFRRLGRSVEYASEFQVSAYLFTKELEIQATAAKACDDTNIRSAFPDVFLFSFAFWRVGDILEHEFFLVNISIREHQERK
jgi:hypothetical protein